MLKSIFGLHCPDCRGKISESDRICPHCGIDLEAPIADEGSTDKRPNAIASPSSPAISSSLPSEQTEPELTTRIICPQCCQQIANSVNFCPVCGASIQKTNAGRVLLTDTQSAHTQSAVRSISCAVRDCANSVIGQCTGYKTSCGRFYCAMHSAGTLCIECSNRQAEDERVQRIYEDYLNAAQEVERYRPPMTITRALLALGMAISAIIALSVKDSFLLFGLVSYALAAIFFWSQNRETNKSRQVRVDEAAKTKPGFREFYETWKKERSADKLKTLLVVAGVIVAGAVGATASEIQRSHKDAQIRDAADRAVDDELRRRGY